MHNFEGFFDSLEVAGKQDRLYNSTSFADFFKIFITTGIVITKEFGEPKLQLLSTQTREIELSPFACMINGYAFSKANTTILQGLGVPGDTRRIDSVVVRVNTKIDKRKFEIYIKQGTLEPPVLERNMEIFEIALFNIKTTNANEITIESTITDKNRCGISYAKWDLQEDFIKGEGRMFVSSTQPVADLVQEGDLWIKLKEV